ncbi:MAG: hypothetical protein LBT54_03885 [Bifidobacteriaceae bacterium]|jgi:hypothetical protein|nr:hypothetical protein [Bifidobacteriaceae bacterium]
MSSAQTKPRRALPWAPSLAFAAALVAALLVPYGASNAAAPALGQPNDGVDLSSATGLYAPGAHVYFGTYRHATAVTLPDDPADYSTTEPTTAREDTATPILWRVVGQEQANGVGDGYITALSEYVLDTRQYLAQTEEIEALRALDPTSAEIIEAGVYDERAWDTPGDARTKQYAGSDIQQYLAGDFRGNFTTGELAGVPSVDVVTKTYKNGQRDAWGFEIEVPYTHLSIRPNGANFIQKYSSSVAPAQQFYLAWNTISSGPWSYFPHATAWDDTLYWSANGTVSRNEPDNVNNSVYRRPDLTANPNAWEYGHLKGDPVSRVNWWTRSACTGGAYHIQTVKRDDDGGSETLAAYREFGLRPVFKLDPAKIVFASEIAAPAANGATAPVAGNYAAATAAGAKNYKLTVVNPDVKLNALTRGTAALADGASLAVAPGEAINLAGTATGGANALAYKIVGGPATDRVTLAYGVGTATSVTAAASRNLGGSGNLAAGAYTLYVWAQKSNALNSNEASQPRVITLNVRTPGATTVSITIGSSPTAKVGGTLAAAGLPAGWGASYQWLRNGKAIAGATGGAYKPTADDAGATLTLKVTASRAGFDTVTTTSKAVAIAKIAPKVKVKKLKSGKLKVTVTAKGIAKPVGKVTVKFGQKYSKTYQITAKNSGVITKAVPKKVKSGAYKVTATFKGNTQVAKKTSSAVKVKIG